MGLQPNTNEFSSANAAMTVGCALCLGDSEGITTVLLEGKGLFPYLVLHYGCNGIGKSVGLGLFISQL